MAPLHRPPPPAGPVLPKLPPWVPQARKGPGTTAAVAPPICQGQAVAWARHTSGPHAPAWTLMVPLTLRGPSGPACSPPTVHGAGTGIETMCPSHREHLLQFLISQLPPHRPGNPHRRHSVGEGRAVRPRSKAGITLKSPSHHPSRTNFHIPPGSLKELTCRKDLTCYYRFKFLKNAQHIGCYLALLPKLPETNNPKPTRCWRATFH